MAEEEQVQKKSSKLKLIIIILFVVILGGAGYFAYTKFFAGGDAPAEQNATQQDQQQSQSNEPRSPADAVVVSLDSFTVNLADPLGRRYLKVTIDVELINEDASAQLTANDPKVKDRIITLLTSMSYADISSPEGKLLLKNEIVDRLNQILGGPKVLNVYFTEFIVQ